VNINQATLWECCDTIKILKSLRASRFRHLSHPNFDNDGRISDYNNHS